MGGKRLSRFFTSSSASTPKRQQRTSQAEAEFKRTAEERERKLNQIHNPPPRVPAPPPPPPPEWAQIVGNDEHAWIDESDDEDERGEVVTPAPNVRRRTYRKYFAKRQDFFREWAHLEDQMMATYLYCQHTTKNWTTQQSYHEVKPIGCSCSLEDHQPARQIDLIDILGHQSTTMRFCKCQPEVIQLLHRGYIASSPAKPRTAFSVRYIQLYHDLWEQSGLNKSGFVQGLIKFTSRRTRCKLAARGIQQNSRILRVPFSNAHDVYARISRLQNSLYHDGMLHTKEELWADKCPRCFGPAEGEDPTDEEFFSIFCMDGNFQQRHNTEASKDHPLDEGYPSIFVKPSDIQRNEVALDSTANVNLEGGQHACSDSHKAANDLRNTSTWAHCDDTGLFAASCRHDVPLRIANIYKTGEKLYYPIAVIQSILKDFPGRKFGVLYDIGCHLERHLNCRDLLPEHREQLEFATSVFHAYVHEWKCQIRYNPRYNENWGLSDGEGLERFWSFLSALVPYLRTSTRTHRLWAISDRSEHYTKVLRESSGKWLLTRMKQAHETVKKSQTLLTNIYALPNPYQPGHVYTEEFFDKQWKDQREAMVSPKVQQEQQKLELGKLLCLEDEHNKAWNTVIQTPEQAITRARLVGDLQKRIAAQRKKIGSDAMTQDLSEQHTNLLLKLWYSKTAIRQLFLALKEEKRPLEIVQQVGMSTKLGQRGQQKVLAAIKTRAAKLRPALDKYTESLTKYKAAFPDRPAPIHITYEELLATEADDAFWNDGLFTYDDQPWAVDTPTQTGMRALARLRRGKEEIRRLQWETRRLMRWATNEFRNLQDLIILIGNHPVAAHSPSTHARLTSFLDQARLSSLPLEERMIAAKVLIHKEFSQLCQLYGCWNFEILEVFQMATSTQPGDASLISTWHYQMAQVLYLDNHNHSSMIEGDFEGVIAGVQAFYNIAPEFQHDVIALRRMQENVPEEPQEDEIEKELGDEEIEVVYEKFMHLDDIRDALQGTSAAGDDFDE